MSAIDGLTLNNRYQILRKIGSGGMADVYLAHDLLLDRDVAIKQLRSQYAADKELLDQFKREAKSAARLVHPYIINIYDVFYTDDNEYIVMEYVDGLTLKEYMQQHKLKLNEVLEIAVRLADGLKHAHSRHIIHCDIKPHNILIDSNLNPKIADFGIAKMVSTQTTVYSGNVMGSVHYLAPEQADGGEITEQSDVYSLGVVLFEMLTGQVPYKGATAVAVAMMHAEKPIPLLANYLESVPEGLQAVINKAMAKRPGDRYRDVAMLGKDLLNLKLKLFPYSSADYEHELTKLDLDTKAAEGVDEATVIMKPLTRPLSKEEQQERTVVLPVKRRKNVKREAYKPETSKKPEPVVEQAREQEDENMARRKRKKLNFTKIMLFVTVCVVLVSVAAHFMFNKTIATVEVPNVVNMSLEDATNTLKIKKLAVEIREGYDPMKKYKPGTVMEQKPKAMEKRKEGSKIVLTVARGALNKAIPDVTTLTLIRAQSVIEEEGFRIGKITRKYDKERLLGAVLGQNPKAGTKAAPNTTIDLVINAGDKTVPSVIGKQQKEAEALIKAAGLKLGDVHWVRDDNKPKGSVVAVNPAVGSKVADGANIFLTVVEGGLSTYIDVVIPGDKKTAYNVIIIQKDSIGSRTIFTGMKKGGDRIRQRVDQISGSTIQVMANGKLIEERML